MDTTKLINDLTTYCQSHVLNASPPSFRQDDLEAQGLFNVGVDPEIIEGVNRLATAVEGASTNFAHINVQHTNPQLEGLLDFFKNRLPEFASCENVLVLLATIILSYKVFQSEGGNITSTTLQGVLVAYCSFRWPDDTRIAKVIATIFIAAHAAHQCKTMSELNTVGDNGFFNMSHNAWDVAMRYANPNESEENYSNFERLLKTFGVKEPMIAILKRSRDSWGGEDMPIYLAYASEKDPEAKLKYKEFLVARGFSERELEEVNKTSFKKPLLPQVGGFEESIVVTLLGYLYYSANKKDIPTMTMNKFLKSVGDMPKMTSGIAMVIENILSIFQKFIDFLSNGLGVEPWKLKSSMFPELEGVQKDFDNLVSKLRDGAPYDYDNAMYLFEIEKRASNICAKIPASRDYAEYKKNALTLISAIKPLVSRMERNNIVGNGPRREPLGIMFGGPTGVGKSTSIVPLILAVNAAVMPREKLDSFEKNHSDHIWVYDPENPFHDSFHGQFNTIIDEAGAHHDVKGSPDPGALGALRMINTANYPLHMAHLEDKGNCNFNSELVWATTNRKFFKWESMYSSEAYVRRFSQSYAVFPKAEYCTDATKDGEFWNRRLDKSKIPVTPTGFSEDVAEFHPHNYLTGKTQGNFYTFPELIDHIVEVYKVHRDGADRLLRFHSDIKNRYLAKRKVAEVKLEPSEDSVIEYELEMFDAKNELLPQSGFRHTWELYSAKVYENTCYPRHLIDEAVKILTDTGFTPSMSALMGACSERVNHYLEPFTSGWIFGLKKFLVEHKNKFLLGLAAAIPVIMIIWKLAKPILFVEQVGGTYNVRKPVKVRPTKARSSKAINRLHREALGEQAGINMNCLAVCSKIVKQSLYTFGVEKKDGAIVPFGYTLFVRGRCCIIPEHFSHAIENMIADGECVGNPIIHFTRVGAKSSGFETLWADIDVTYIEGVNDDVNYLTINQACHEHPDITKHLAPTGHTKLFSKFPGAMLRSLPDGGFTLVSTVVHQVGAQKYGGFEIDNGLTYEIATNSGECGAPIFLVGTSNQPIIVGIHVAGNKSSGTATRVLKERVVEALQSVPFISSEISVEPQSIVKMPDNFLVHHDVVKLRVPFKSRIKKSPLYEAWGPSDYAPSKLRPFKLNDEIVDPWSIARAKYSKKAKCVNLYLLNAVTYDTIKAMLFAADPDEDPWEHRMYTFEEAVAGVDGVDFCDGITRTTSPGYPYVLENKGKGKTDWFGADGPVEFSSAKCEALRSHIVALQEKISNRERIDVLYADFLKDERRPKAKAEAGKARLVSASPMDALILFKMYFGDLVRWIMANRIKNGSAVGVNPYGHEWGHIVHHLKYVGDKSIFGDFSGYDGSLSPVFEYGFLLLANTFYYNQTAAQRNARETIFEEIVNSRHVTVGKDDQTSVVYEWFGGNPSGNLLTTVLNTFCNLNIVKYNIASAWAKHIGLSHLTLEDHHVDEFVPRLDQGLRMIAFGDDGGMNVSDEFAEFVNQTILTECMADIGFTFTDEIKSGGSHIFRDITSCSFLKRGFVKHKGTWVAPLELGVILEMPYWTKEGSPPGTEQDIVDTALMELSLHGEGVYAEWAPRIVSATIEALAYQPEPRYRANLSIASHAVGSY